MTQNKPWYVTYRNAIVASILTVIVVISFSAFVLRIYGDPAILSLDDDTDIETSYTFSVINPYDGGDEDIDDAIAYVYILDTSDWTSSRLMDLNDEINDYSNYELDDSDEWSDVEIEIEEGVYYLVKIVLSGYCTVFLSSFSSTELGNPQILTPGINAVLLVDQFDSMSLLTYSTNNGTQPIDLTGEQEWTVSFIARDSDGDSTKHEGYNTYVDFTTDIEYSLVIKIVLNTTALTSYCDLETEADYRIAAGGNILYIVIENVMFSEMVSYELEFSSGIDTDYYIVSLAIGIGDETSFTQSDITSVSIEYGSLDALAVVLSESYVSTDDIEMNTTVNELNITAPTNANFNSSNIDVGVKDVDVFNYTDGIDTFDSFGTDIDLVSGEPLMLPIRPSIDCNISEISLYVETFGDAFVIMIYNTDPDGMPNFVDSDQDFYGDDAILSEGWHTFLPENNPPFLNISEDATFNQTYWIIITTAVNTTLFTNGTIVEDKYNVIGVVDGGPSYTDSEIMINVSYCPIVEAISDPTDITMLFDTYAVDGDGFETTDELTQTYQNITLTESDDWGNTTYTIDNMTINYTMSDVSVITYMLYEGNSSAFVYTTYTPTDFEAGFDVFTVNLTTSIDYTVTGLTKDGVALTLTTDYVVHDMTTYQIVEILSTEAENDSVFVITSTGTM